MNYGADIFEMYRQVGLYTGTILKGTVKPADLPVQRSTKFEFVINRTTAKTLGLDIPLMLRVAPTELIDYKLAADQDRQQSRRRMKPSKRPRQNPRVPATRLTAR